MKLTTLKKYLPETIALIIATIALSYVFFTPIGLADGGMFYRTLETRNIYYITEPTAEAAQFQFLRNGTEWDIRRQSITHFFILLAAIFLIVNLGKTKNNFTNILLAILTPLIFTDFAYTAYLNTFFPQRIFLAYTLLGAAIFLNPTKYMWIPGSIALIFAAFFALTPSTNLFPVAPVTLTQAAANAYNIRPGFLSNFSDQNALATGWNAYSHFKNTFIPNTLTFTLIFLAIYVIGALYLKAPRKFLLLPLLALASLFLPVYFTGLENIGINLFAFNVYFDLMVLSGIVGSIYLITKRNADIRAKFGVKQ